MQQGEENLNKTGSSNNLINPQISQSFSQHTYQANLQMFPSLSLSNQMSMPVGSQQQSNIQSQFSDPQSESQGLKLKKKKKVVLRNGQDFNMQQGQGQYDIYQGQQQFPNFFQTLNMQYQANSSSQQVQGSTSQGNNQTSQQPQSTDSFFNNQQSTPQSQYSNYGNNNTINGNSGQQPQQQDKELDEIVQNILNLRKGDKREQSLAELSKMRESYQNLAPLLWHSIGTVAILIQDIVAVYPILSSDNLTQNNSTRLCNVLGLLQCLALHPEIKTYFLNASIPLFLYPFLSTNQKTKPYENLRVTSLGVIGALVKGDDSEAISYLMSTEIIPLCLKIMKRGQELSKTVATFIIQKILLDEGGLNYVCQTAERFYAVINVLDGMISDLASSEKEDQRLLRHIIRCYLRLSENSRANEALLKCLPQILKDPQTMIISDDVIKKWHSSLLENLKLNK